MKLNVIRPTYVSRFHCLGSECNYTCCQGWNIYLSKKEYLKIKNIRKPKEIEALFRVAFPRNKKGDDPDRYARARFDEKNRCRFFDENKLCSLQLSCGPEALPKTCQVYPRHESLLLDVIEEELSLGCEEVVRLVLAETEGICFESKEEKRSDPTAFKTFLINEQMVERRPVFRHIWDIKTLAASILQNRSLPMDDRMILLGVALQEVDRMEKENRVDQIGRYVDGFLTSLDQETTLADGLKSVSPNVELQVFSALPILSVLAKRDRRLGEVMQNIYKKLDIKESYRGEFNFQTGDSSDEGEEKEELVSLEMGFEVNFDQYGKASEHLERFLNGREYILENLTVSWFFFHQQPFYGKASSIWDNYIYFVNLYNLLKFLLTAYLDEDSDDSDLIYLVAVSSRALTHASDLFEVMLKHANKHQCNTLAHMAILIKS